MIRKIQSLIYRYQGILREQCAQKALYANEREYNAAIIKTMRHIVLAQGMLLRKLNDN